VYSPANANDFSNFSNLRQNEAYAGAYFTFKFGGDSKNAKNNRFQYGLAGGLRRSSFDFNGRPNFSNAADTLFPYSQSVFSQRQFKEVRIFDTAFDASGFDKFSLANIPVYKRNQYGELEFLKFGLDENDSSDGIVKKSGRILLISAGVIVLVLGAAALAFNPSTDFDEDE